MKKIILILVFPFFLSACNDTQIPKKYGENYITTIIFTKEMRLQPANSFESDIYSKEDILKEPKLLKELNCFDINHYGNNKIQYGYCGE